MLMVCVLHINLFGRYNEISWQEKPWEWLSWGGAESLCIIAVNLYAMITGYVSITSPWHINRYIVLWLQVTFYTVGIYALGFILFRTDLKSCLEFRDALSHLTTVPLAGAYWYFNAYTVLFFLIPFLNTLLLKLSGAAHTRLLAVLLIVLPLMKVYKGGYNAGRLSALYCAGAFIRLHPIPTQKSSTYLLLYLLGIAGFSILLLTPLHGVRDILFSIGYDSPFLTIASLSLLLVFKNLNIKQQWQKKAIRFVAPLTFGVYLVHCHPVVWDFLRRLGKQFITEYGHPVWVPLVGGLSLFIACAYIDWVRLHIFRWCHARMLADKLEAVLIRIWGVMRARCRSFVTDTPRHP